MKLRALPILAALVFALASPLLAAEDPQAPYQKPAIDETQPVQQPEDLATQATRPAEPPQTTTSPDSAQPLDLASQQDDAATTTTTTTPTPEDGGLPKTASPLALLALLGVGGAGSAYGLRQARRR